MIGDEYLQVRAQLGTALFTLSTLAHGLEMGREVLQSLHDIRANLREPFLFIVLGDAKSGKTSLINALFGSEISPVGAQQDEQDARKLHLFKYGSEEKSTQFNDHLVENYHPDPLLRDFNILDTPGEIDVGQHAIIEHYLPVAELVLFVFSINHPWSPSAWELLKLAGGNPEKNIIFVLQQCDLRDDFEVNAVAIHLAQTLHEKISPACRIFPVSAMKAYLSRTTGTDREGLMQQSGFAALESYINDTVIQSESRKEKLRLLCDTARIIAADAGRKATETLAFIKKEIEQLGRLNSGLEERKEQSLRHVHGILWTLADSYERLQKHGEELLQQLLPIALVPRFKSPPVQEKLPQSVDAELQDSIQRQIQSSIELLAADLQKTWRQMQESLGKRFPVDMQEAHTTEFLRDRAELFQSLESLLTDKMSGTDLQWQMTELFTETAEWLQIHRDAGPGGVITALAWFVAADFSKTLAEAAEAAGSVSALMKRGRIQGRFRAEMARRREDLLAAMEDQLRRATGHFYQQASEALHPLQTFYTGQKAVYEPRITMAKQTAETLEKAAASLGWPA